MAGIPTEVTRIAAEAGLGEVVERYRPSLVVELSFAVTCGVLGVAGLLFGDDVGRGIGVATTALGLLFVVPAWRKSRRFLYLCSGGLLTTSGPVTVTRLVRWDDVVHLRIWMIRSQQMGPPEAFPRCVLELADGGTLNLARPPYAHLDRLTAAVELAVAGVVRPRRTAELAETGATTFGPLTVDSAGIRDGDRLARWSEVVKVERGRHRFRVWTRSGRPVISRSVRTVPDLLVLLAIVSERLGTTR